MANIILIGFMGSGKTTIGFRLARALGWQFVDTDDKIEKLTGTTVTQIFKKHGEIRFRSEEKLMVQKVAALDKTVIATGGGVPTFEGNVTVLKKNGIVIWLKAAPEIVLDRIGKSRNRPLLRKYRDLDQVKGLVEERARFYEAAADLTIDTGDKTHDQIVGEIINSLRGKLS